MEKKFIILTEGNTHPTPAKMAAALLRYHPDKVLALIDSENSGRDVSELMEIGRGIPIVDSVETALRFKPDTLLVGITPPGGALPAEWKGILVTAIKNGLDIYSGMHTFLNDDPELVALAQQYQVQLVDLRCPPKDISVNTCKSRNVKSFRIHTVGTDCNCGKKVTAVELDRALQKMGKNSRFVASGQSGILISGAGIAMDRVISDFVSGAADRLVLENQDYDYLMIEGQGAITHPLYSGVTLSMLHGFAPHGLILCHQVSRSIMRGTPDVPVVSIPVLIDLYEKVTQHYFPTKVIGISLNLHGLPKDQIQSQIKSYEKEFGLPVTDVISVGPEPLVEAILDFEKSIKK